MMRALIIAGLMVSVSGCVRPTSRQPLGIDHQTTSAVTIPDQDIDRLKRARSQVDRWGPICTALDEFCYTIGRFPTTGEGLDALVAPPRTLTVNERAKWKKPFIAGQLLLDPWGRKLQYQRSPARNGTRVAQRDHTIMGNRIVFPTGTRLAISPDRSKLAIYPDVVDLWSLGPDGIDDTGDELGNWDSYVAREPSDLMVLHDTIFRGGHPAWIERR